MNPFKANIKPRSQACGYPPVDKRGDPLWIIWHDAGKGCNLQRVSGEQLSKSERWLREPIWRLSAKGDECLVLGPQGSFGKPATLGNLNLS